MDRYGLGRGRLDVRGGASDPFPRGRAELAQPVEELAVEREAEAALAAGEGGGEGAQLRVQGIDRFRRADRRAEVDPPRVAERLDLDGLAAAQHDGAHRQLVDERLQRIGNAEARRRVEIAARGADVDRIDACRVIRDGARRAIGNPALAGCGRGRVPAELGGCARRHQVRLAGRRADPEQPEQPGALELRAELELASGHPVEPAEVEIMSLGRQAGTHRVEVHPVAGGVDEHVAAVDCSRHGPRLTGCGPGIRAHGTRLALAVALGDRRGAALVDVEQEHRRDLVGLSEVADDRRGDRPPGPEHGDLQLRALALRATCSVVRAEPRQLHFTSSLARSASQSSIRSWARLRSRPVSSSILRMR
jgi:hypothetical protein